MKTIFFSDTPYTSKNKEGRLTLNHLSYQIYHHQQDRIIIKIPITSSIPNRGQKVKMSTLLHQKIPHFYVF